MKGLFLSITLTVFTISCFAQEKYILTSDSVKLFINIRGKGEPCLFIHGGPGQGAISFEMLGNKIGESCFKMIYLDQRGCGRSESPKDDNYDIIRMIQDFEEIRNKLGIKQWHLMGHSFGGILQTYYAYKYPKSIKTIMMLNSTLNMAESINTGYFPSHVEFLNITDKEYFLDESISVKIRLDSIVKISRDREDLWKLTFDNLEAAEDFYKTYEYVDNFNVDFANNVFSNDSYFADFKEYTSEIEHPVLFIYSKKDKNVGPNSYKNLKFPNISMVEIDCLHMGFINKNKEYANAIRVFYNDNK